MGVDAQLGERLRQVREHRDKSQSQLAKASGVTVGTIQNYERGRVVISVDRIEQLAHALQCEPADLMAPPGSPPPRYRRRSYRTFQQSTASRQSTRMTRTKDH